MHLSGTVREKIFVFSSVTWKLLVKDQHEKVARHSFLKTFYYYFIFYHKQYYKYFSLLLSCLTAVCIIYALYTDSLENTKRWKEKLNYHFKISKVFFLFFPLFLTQIKGKSSFIFRKVTDITMHAHVLWVCSSASSVACLRVVATQ